MYVTILFECSFDGIRKPCLCLWISEDAEPKIRVHIQANLKIRFIFPPNLGICNNKTLKFNVHAWYGDVLSKFFGLAVFNTQLFVHLRNKLFLRVRA